MEWFRKLLRQDTQEMEETISEPTPAPQPPSVILPPINGILLKKLKWVVHENQVGIVWDIDTSGYVTIHLVGASGETIGEKRVHGGNIRYARYLEIPEPRRVGLDPAYAASLGYC